MTGSLWVIFIAGCFLTGALTASIFYGFQLIDPLDSKMLISGINCIKISTVMGILFGLIIMLSIAIMRKSQIFWEYAKVVANLIENAETKESLQLIYHNEFQELRKKCQGGPQQITELQRLYTIMQTKIKYVQ